MLLSDIPFWSIIVVAILFLIAMAHNDIKRKTPKHISESAEYNSYIERSCQWFRGSYSPATLTMIFLILLSVFFLLGRIIVLLNAQTRELERQPVIRFINEITQEQYAKFKDDYGDSNSNYMGIVRISVKPNSGDVDGKNSKRLEIYIFHPDSQVCVK